jgi:hypothetical protein
MAGMSQNVTPQRKVGKLIVVAAFDRDEDSGELRAAYGPAEARSEEAAIRTAKSLAPPKHAGVIAWSRDADLLLGDYGPPTVLFTAGDVPEME